ncbi:glycosyltransferase family protein [Thalassospiraceae bacterium LMO-JJ14]|nr:glycosyltransferase family protein [Thalassospiraceae bacterium LMO-JJ14]
MSRAVAVVQARLGSTRLPGKVLMDLNGRSVLGRVLERCLAIPGIAAVVCATTDDENGALVAAEAENCGAFAFRGSEADVLDRMVGAARTQAADIVLRVTADCPAIDPEVCGAVLRLLQDTGAAYATNNMPPSWPHGLDVEAMRMVDLEESWRTAHDPDTREHVTLDLRSRDGVSRVNLLGPGGDATDHRWTLDTADDLRFFQTLFTRLPEGAAGFPWRAVEQAVRQPTDISGLNTHQDSHRVVRNAFEHNEPEIEGYTERGQRFHLLSP